MTTSSGILKIWLGISGDQTFVCCRFNGFGDTTNLDDIPVFVVDDDAADDDDDAAVDDDDDDDDEGVGVDVGVGVTILGGFE